MVAAAPKLAFDNGGAFIQDTRREVEQYLARRTTRVKGAIRLYLKAPIALALTAVSWSVLIFVQPPLVVALLCLVGLVVGAMLTAFCVQHDANHGAYFKKRRWNHLVGWSTDSLLGFSSYAWRLKHNVAHHTYTNVDGYDDDATQVPLARRAVLVDPSLDAQRHGEGREQAPDRAQQIERRLVREYHGRIVEEIGRAHV